MFKYVNMSVFLHLLVLAAIASAMDVSASPEEEVVLAVEDEWILAEIVGDEATLRRMIHNRFNSNANRGRTNGKEEAITNILAWSMTGQTLSERSIVVDGDAAITFGTAEL